MASEDTTYSDNDTGPFAGPTHELIFGGPGPQEVDVDMRDTDVMVNVWVDRNTVRLLHLQNVREDTIDAARKAVDSFLDQLKAVDDREGTHPERAGHTMLEDFTQAHSDLRDYLEKRADELGLRFKWSHGGFPRQALRPALSQPRYYVRLCEDGDLETRTGSRGLPYPVPRGHAQSRDDSNNKEA